MLRASLSLPTLYFHKDHLGSSTATTDAAGAILEQTDYMPFGGQRGIQAITATNYGYTDQERDPEIGLYNYGARLYDPMMGRFVSPDIIVPSPFDPQTLNRYSYCYNNPMVYTDPSGHWGLSNLVGAIVGAVVGAVKAAISGEDILEGAVTGAVSGLLFSFAGDFIASGIVTDQLTGMTMQTLSAAEQAMIHVGAGAVSGGINSAITGGDIDQGILLGAASAGFSKYVGVNLYGQHPVVQGAGYMLSGAVMGGGVAQLTGGDFGEGFVRGLKTAAFGYAFNQMRMGQRIGKFVEGVWNFGKTVWNGATYAVACARRDVAALAVNGHPLPRTALGLAFATTAGPASYFSGYWAIPATESLSIWAGTIEGQQTLMGAYYYLNSSLPGIPNMNRYGFAGYIASKINDKLFGNKF